MTGPIEGMGRSSRNSERSGVVILKKGIMLARMNAVRIRDVPTLVVFIAIQLHVQI
jgi:hypothetical protein